MLIFNETGTKAYCPLLHCWGVYLVDPDTMNPLLGTAVLDGIVLTEREARDWLRGEWVDVLSAPVSIPFDLTGKDDAR